MTYKNLTESSHNTLMYLYILTNKGCLNMQQPHMPKTWFNMQSEKHIVLVKLVVQDDNKMKRYPIINMNNKTCVMYTNISCNCTRRTVTLRVIPRPFHVVFVLDEVTM
jgi:hypothetical protein